MPRPVTVVIGLLALLVASCGGVGAAGQAGVAGTASAIDRAGTPGGASALRIVAAESSWGSITAQLAGGAAGADGRQAARPDRRRQSAPAV